MQSPTFKRTPATVAAAVIALVCLLAPLRLGFVERPEWMTYDWRVRLAQGHSSEVATNLGVVKMTEDTLDAIRTGVALIPWGTNQAQVDLGTHYGLYWPRNVYGRLVRELKAQGADTVGFDVLFGELREDHASSPISVRGLLQQATNDVLVQQFLKTKAAVAYDDFVSITPDALFALQLRNASNVVLAGTSRIIPPGLFRTNAVGLGDISAERDADGVLRRTRAFSVYRRWHPALLTAERGAGFQLDDAIVKKDRIILPQGKGKPLTIVLDADGNFDLMNFVDGELPPGFARMEKPFTGERRIWSLAVVLAAHALNLDLDHAEVDLEHGRIVLRGPGNVTRVIPVDRDGWFYVDWEMTSSDPRLTTESLESVVARDCVREQGQTDAEHEQWKGKLVIVGSEATGNELTDRGATPLENDVPLMTRYWNVANSLIQGRFVTRAGLGAEWCLIVFVGAVSAFLTMRLRILIASAAVFAGIAAYAAAVAWVYVEHRYWLPMVLPIFGGGFMQYAILATYRVVFEQDEKRKVKSLFSRLVSPNIVNELLQSQQLSLKGERREITVLFADIRGFTELTDSTYERALHDSAERKLSAVETERQLDEAARQTLETVNLYLGMLADIVKRHDGTLDKYIGDCVMAFWGAPSPQSQHALACVRAAIDAQRSIYRLNQERIADNGRRETENQQRRAANQPLLPLLPALQMGSGINTGLVSVGLMGSDEHIINYTVFGREVNLASRLESLSGRGRIIVGETTFKHLQREDPPLAATCVAQPPVTVKGFRGTVQVYEVPWQESGATSPVPETLLKTDTTFEHHKQAPPAG